MKNRKPTMCLILLFFWIGVPALGGNEQLHFNTTIRVLLDRGVSNSKVRSLLEATYIKPQASYTWHKLNKELDIRMDKSRTLTFAGSQRFPDQGLFVRGGPYPTDKLQYQSALYRGALKWTRTPKGFLITNHLTLNDYLLGTLGSEMSPSWELEALKAQAVASRTYALYMVQHPKNAEYDLESGTQDQVYGGVEGSGHTAVQEAVQSTADEYLSHSNKPIKSFFHSRCGGQTETSGFVWSLHKPVPNRPVHCPYCLKNPYSWSAGINLADLLQALQLPSVTSVRIAAQDISPSGRIGSLRLSAGGKETQVLTDQLRGLLGYGKLKSARFHWQINGPEIRFEGTGNGHGVGMCQWGARFLAKQGKTYKEILSYYYPGATLSKL